MGTAEILAHWDTNPKEAAPTPSTESIGESGFDTNNLTQNKGLGGGDVLLEPAAGGMTSSGNSASHSAGQLPQWFTVWIRIDTAVNTEVFARTGDAMPVSGQCQSRLKPENGLHLVAYADDPHESYGIYAI